MAAFSILDHGVPEQSSCTVAGTPREQVMNLRKREGIKMAMEVRQAELDACLDGSWPQDINDAMRWLNCPPGVTEKDYAAHMCRFEIEALVTLDKRLQLLEEGQVDSESIIE